MLEITVSEGDVTNVPSNALITAINSGGMWFGGIDRAIQRSASNMFHSQAAEQKPLIDGEVIYAPALDGHRGLFGSVIFVIDDLQRPLREIVLTGLQEAERRKCTTVSLPFAPHRGDGWRIREDCRGSARRDGGGHCTVQGVVATAGAIHTSGRLR